MLRDLLIDKELFKSIRSKALKSEWEEDGEQRIVQFEKAVLRRLRKKRSVKKYKKKGVKRADLKEMVELASIVSLEVFNGPSNLQIAEEHPGWCDHCGSCCTESSPIFIHKDELNPILTFKPELEEDIIPNKHYPGHFQFREDKPCKFYDHHIKRCKIYNIRPQVCRNYPLTLEGSAENAHYTVNLRENCNYAIHIVLLKSMILFDEALRRLENR